MTYRQLSKMADTAIELEKKAIKKNDMENAHRWHLVWAIIAKAKISNIKNGGAY